MSERPVQSLQQSPKGWKRPSARAPGSHGWALFPGPGGGHPSVSESHRALRGLLTTSVAGGGGGGGRKVLSAETRAPFPSGAAARAGAQIRLAR